MFRSAWAWVGNNLQAIQELQAPKPRDIAPPPDLAGGVFIVTGGSSGIGKEIARTLLNSNGKVYVTCRSPESAEATIRELSRETGKTVDDVHALVLDLTDFATIKTAADRFLRDEKRLDVLYNSAGVLEPPISWLTAHGHDVQFGTHVLGHFYLTQLLLPILRFTAATSLQKHVRVVNVAATVHWMAPNPEKGGPIVYDTLVDGPARRSTSLETLYVQSKAGVILFSHALARKYGDHGIVSIAVSPSTTDTPLLRHYKSVAASAIRFVATSLSLGALTPLIAGTYDVAKDYNGLYLVPWGRIRHNRPDLDVIETQDRLWEWCEEQVKTFAPSDRKEAAFELSGSPTQGLGEGQMKLLDGGWGEKD